MSVELCYLSTTEALQQFKTRQLSPVELMSALIARAQEQEPLLNAFSDTFFEQAMEQARESETRWSRGEPIGELDGIAVAIKDEVDVKGQRNTEGSLVHEHDVADEDAVLVARLRAAGAIFHARTTCPEFSSLWNTHSRLHGVTRNPWNLEITPGGSSGGAGASLAAGTSMLASGSDIGGSIRFPAAQSGLVGFKPPYGRIPETLLPFNMEPYCANGPMAHTVADAALMQNIMSGADRYDAASTLPRVELPLHYPAHLKGQRIAFSMDLGYLDLEPDVARNTQDMVERLRGLGAEVVEVNPNFPQGIERAYNGHMDPLFTAGIASLLDTHRELLCDYNIALAEEGLRRMDDKQAFHDAAMIEAQMYRVYTRMMEGFDAFVCPTAMATGLRADFNPAHEAYKVNGRKLAWDLELSTCHHFNMMGRCPAISVPSGIGDIGVPTGLQITALAYDDLAVFKVAAALETTWDKPFRP